MSLWKSTTLKKKMTWMWVLILKRSLRLDHWLSSCSSYRHPFHQSCCGIFLTIRNFYKLKAYDTLESLSFRFMPDKKKNYEVGFLGLLGSTFLFLLFLVSSSSPKDMIMILMHFSDQLKGESVSQWVTLVRLSVSPS